MNTEHAIAILDTLSHGGVREVVICPGSRSTPLALAAEAHPDTRTHVIIDERSAGFFALGLSKATGHPACVITTSGTAVANLGPAMAEAHNANVPLILLTADRPPRLWESGANQTLDQQGLFSRFCRATLTTPLPSGDTEAVRKQVQVACLAAQTFPSGPVQIDVPLDKPLEPDATEQERLATLTHESPRTPVPVRSFAASSTKAELPNLTGRRGLIVVGPRHDMDLIGPLTDWAEAWGIPIIADAVSGCRGSPEAVAHADLFLRGDRVAALQPDWIVQFGASPTSKHVKQALAAWQAPRYRIDESGRTWDELGEPTFVDASPIEACRHWANTPEPGKDAAWRSVWATLDATTADAIYHGMHDGGHPNAEPQWVHAVTDMADLLFVGNSMPVRDLESFGRPRGRVWANRGVSGIDGTLATACGIATASEGPVVAVLGDVAFQHDVGSLACMPTNLRLIVIENGGGRIFHHLPVASKTPHFDRLFLTPPAVDVQKAAAAFDRSACATTPAGLPDALTTGAQVIAMTCDGAKSVAFRHGLQDLVERSLQSAGL